MHFSTLIVSLSLALGAVNAATCGGSSSCTPGKVKNTRCRVECGVDYAGGDYGQHRVASFNDCISLCDKDVQCTDAQFSKDNSYCYLKNKLTRSSLSKNVDSIVCDGKPSSSTTTTSTKKPTTIATATTTVTTRATTIITTTSVTTTSTSTTASASSTPTPCTSLPNPYTSTSNTSKVFNLHCGQAWGADGIKGWVYVDSFPACVEACAQDPECIAVTSGKNGFLTCYLYRDSAASLFDGLADAAGLRGLTGIP